MPDRFVVSEYDVIRYHTPLQFTCITFVVIDYNIIVLINTHEGLCNRAVINKTKLYSALFMR